MRTAHTLLTRLVEAVRRYTRAVHRSREELSESTQEQALPPIPPGDRHSGSVQRR